MEKNRQLPPTRKALRPERSKPLDITKDPTSSEDTKQRNDDTTSSTDPVHTADSSTINSDHPNEGTSITEEESSEKELDHEGNSDPSDEDDSQPRTSSAKSDISLVGAPSDSEHRTFLRRVKAEMTEQQHRAERRRSQFEERRVSVQERANMVSIRRASRRFSQVDTGNEEGDRQHE